MGQIYFIHLHENTRNQIFTNAIVTISVADDITVAVPDFTSWPFKPNLIIVPMLVK